MYLTIVCVVLAVTACILKSIIKPRRFPPGPKWYPFFGSSAIVQKLTLQYGSQWKAVSHLAKQYSTDILGLKLGSEKVVVLFGERILKNDFTHPAFDGRPDTFFLRLRCLGKRLGITFTDGPLWKEHRGFTVKNLKNVGFGKTTMETEIQKELLNIIDYIDTNKSKPINPKILLAMSVMNILWKFTAGEKIKEEKLAHLLDIMAKRSKAFTMSGGKLNQWPWLRHVFPELTGYSLVNKMNKELSDIIREAIDKHKKGVVKDNDFMYLFLKEMQQGRSTFTEDQLEIISLDILIAGSQTTSSTLEFALLMALRNPTMQNKIYDEIRTVLGDDMPCWEDTSRLIYTMAFLCEIQRYFVITPLIGPRRMLSDYTLDGYLLSEGTTILMSIGDVHFDPQTWDEPEKFNPERFLNDKGELIKTEQIYPFGLGRRRCPGDSFSRPFVFITFVGIMQKFRISCCNGVLPSDEPVIGLLSSARPFVADFTARQS